MATWLYFGTWLFAALVAAAFLSARIAKHLRLREVRRRQGALLLDALERYAEWVSAQRHAPVFHGESPEAAEALDQAALIRLGWFPELAPDMAELLAAHNRLVQFLVQQHALRQNDPDAWIETDHDARFLALWRHLATLIQTVQAKLSLIGSMSLAEEVVAGPSAYVPPQADTIERA